MDLHISAKYSNKGKQSKLANDDKWKDFASDQEDCSKHVKTTAANDLRKLQISCEVLAWDESRSRSGQDIECNYN